VLHAVPPPRHAAGDTPACRLNARLGLAADGLPVDRTTEVWVPDPYFYRPV
jgi:hypothetical protein